MTGGRSGMCELCGKVRQLNGILKVTCTMKWGVWLRYQPQELNWTPPTFPGSASCYLLFLSGSNLGLFWPLWLLFFSWDLVFSSPCTVIIFAFAFLSRPCLLNWLKLPPLTSLNPRAYLLGWIHSITSLSHDKALSLKSSLLPQEKH